MSIVIRLCSLAAVLLLVRPAAAQGLVWSLPDDGTLVRYEGTYSHVLRRPDSPEGDATWEWTRHLTIASVGQEMADYNGEQQPCRWLEFRTVTGLSSNGQVEPGPGSERIYKVLVPEAVIQGRDKDESRIPVSFLPIVKGFRKIGDQPPQPLESPAFDVYPLVALVQHYVELEPQGEPQSLDIPVGSVTAQLYTGELTLENRRTRTTNRAVELWQSDEVPFGLAKWIVRISREEKEPQQPRTEFRPLTETTVEMSAHAIEQNAQSLLNVP